MFTYTIKTDCPKAGKNTIVVHNHDNVVDIIKELLFAGRRGATFTVEIK